MAATVVGDATIAPGCQKEHLVVPCVCAQRPTVAEDHRLAAAPVFIIKIYVAGIFFTNIDVRHLKLSFLFCCFLQTDGGGGAPQRDSPLAFLPACVRPLGRPRYIALCKIEAVESITILNVLGIPQWPHPGMGPLWYLD
jgi:hypothetical protein